MIWSSYMAALMVCCCPWGRLLSRILIWLLLIRVFEELLICLHFFKRFYLFLERGEGREKEREGNIYQLPLAHTLTPATQACAQIRNRTSDLLLCGTTPNQLSHTGQGSTVLLIALVWVTQDPWSGIIKYTSVIWGQTQKDSFQIGKWGQGRGEVLQ